MLNGKTTFSFSLKKQIRCGLFYYNNNNNSRQHTWARGKEVSEKKCKHGNSAKKGRVLRWWDADCTLQPLCWSWRDSSEPEYGQEVYKEVLNLQRKWRECKSSNLQILLCLSPHSFHICSCIHPWFPHCMFFMCYFNFFLKSVWMFAWLWLWVWRFSSKNDMSSCFSSHFHNCLFLHIKIHLQMVI